MDAVLVTEPRGDGVTKLEDLTPGAAVRGILPDAVVTVVNAHWFGSEALELTYKGPEGKVANELLYRHDEPRIEVVERGRPWSFDGDGAVGRRIFAQDLDLFEHLADELRLEPQELIREGGFVDELVHRRSAT